MKKIKLLFFIFCFCFNINYVFGQIPNPGFESWIDENTPQDWTTDNLPPVLISVSRTSDAHSGSFAAHGQVSDFSGFPYPPTLQSGEGGFFPYTQRAQLFNGFYKFTPVGQDIFYIIAYLFSNQEVIAFAQNTIRESASSYTQFSLPFNYVTGSTPDSAEIYIFIASDTSITQPHVGSTFDLDDLSFSGEVPTGVNDNVKAELRYDLQQNYPNPFNPVTTIKYEIPEQSFVTLKVFNINGEEVSILQNGELPAGQHAVKFNAADLPSGFYFYRINAGSYSAVRKMILLK